MKRFALFVMVMFLLVGCGSRQEEQPQKAAPQATSLIKDGIQHLQEANPSEAIKSFGEAIKKNPSDPSAYIVLSETYMRMQEYDRAIESLTAATRIAPEQGELYYLLAINYGLQGKKDLAKENAQKSIELFRLQKDQENFVKSLALMQGLMKSEAPPVQTAPSAQ